MSTVHICCIDKFIPSFVRLVNEKFSPDEHTFLVYGDKERFDLEYRGNVHYIGLNLFSNVKQFLQLQKKIQLHDRIILHSFHGKKIALLLMLTPGALKKSYWFIWGADLYKYQTEKRNYKWYLSEFFRRPIIKRMGNLVTYIKGDYELAKEWYGCTGRWHECLLYTSNVYKQNSGINTSQINGDKITILIGNSADPTNNHFSLFDILENYKNQNIEIVAPLSYGVKSYAAEVAAEGYRRFGDKFVPLIDFMPLQQYLAILEKVDIAMFNHNRQQAMGNTITLLGSRKTVFLKSGTTQWDFFQEKGIQVFDIKDFSLKCLTHDEKLENEQKIGSYFSVETLSAQLKAIFNS
ncbi:TDP-N-acetylfucosamine:lipid II N-acetylfucosaminyltransferase family protein [Klebsiella aerogenes]|uniref:TDP-N-acetylfucosamine:lipid II N-acetylfucosaminyltransferase n=1 Tax=Klebsiella aerogenes TaxID=548 RepID=UPI00292E216C|nr:TDP-N-acetylfucosamine:lipid II N-acetylfucosaminyltransferase [Klebsiella aerogenes]